MKNILHLVGHSILYDDIIRADNCILYDSKGNDYLDMESGIWCSSIGHCNPRLIKSLNEQTSAIIHTGFCYINPILDKACEKVLKITGLANGKALFLCSGSEVVDLSIRISRHITGRKLVLTMKDSYHSALGYFDNKDNWIGLAE